MWKPKGHYDLQMGAKGFLTIIFFNLEDRNRVLDGGPYFFNLARFFLRVWKEHFNPDKEDLAMAPIWIWLYSLSIEYWREDILVDLGNATGFFVKASEQTKIVIYTSYAWICAYMDLSKELPESSIYLGKMGSVSSLWIMKISPLDVEGVMNMGISFKTAPWISMGYKKRIKWRPMPRVYES